MKHFLAVVLFFCCRSFAFSQETNLHEVIAIAIRENETIVYASDSVRFSRIRATMEGLLNLRVSGSDAQNYRVSVDQPIKPSHDTPWIQIEWLRNGDVHLLATGSTRNSHVKAAKEIFADEGIDKISISVFEPEERKKSVGENGRQ